MSNTFETLKSEENKLLLIQSECKFNSGFVSDGSEFKFWLSHVKYEEIIRLCCVF